MTEGPSNLPKEVAKRYEPTSQERAALEAYFDHKKEAPPCPRMNVTKGDDGVGEITIDHAEPGLAWTVLTQALGATELTFASTLTCQLSNAVAKGGSATDGLNFMLSVVKAVRAEGRAGVFAGCPNGSSSRCNHDNGCPSRGLDYHQAARQCRAGTE
jgi:hypothetical protein